MTNINDVLDAEYRELIRSLHPATIETVVAIDIWWSRVLFMEVSLYTASAQEEGYPDVEDRFNALRHELQLEVEPRLFTLTYGHPDPAVRLAADLLSKRLFNALMYLDAKRAEKEDETVVAIQLAHRGVAQLIRAAYHAPFRETRPEPDFDGVSIGNTEKLASQLVDVPLDEIDRGSYGLQ